MPPRSFRQSLSPSKFAYTRVLYDVVCIPSAFAKGFVRFCVSYILHSTFMKPRRSQNALATKHSRFYAKWLREPCMMKKYEKHEEMLSQP